MAYDYNKAKEAYESLNEQQRQQFVEQNKNDANFQRFAKEYANDRTRGTVATPNYEHQGAGNYVYNEKTGYYENQTDTSKNTTNQGLVAKPENVKSETPIKQQETIVSTDSKNQNKGALTPLSQDYYNQTGDDAQNKIRYNLNSYRQTNPEYFSTYEDFKRNFSYDLRNAEQKNTLDTWYKGYQQGIELSNIPTSDLYTQYNNGTLSSTDLETLRIYNPEKYAELQNQINKGNIIQAYDDNKDTSGTNLQEMAYEFLAKTFNTLMNGDSSSGASQYFADYEAKMNNPETLELSDKITEIDEQRENILDQISTMTKDVEKEYEGTGATKSKINAIVSDRTYELQQQLRTLDSEYKKYATQYNNRMQQYQNEFQLQLQEYQLGMQERNQKMNELGFAMNLMNFETNEQKAEREWNYWVKQQEYTNGNINSKDYSTRYKAALKSVQNLLSQYEGIPMERSAEQMADDILTAINNGSSLGAELTKINKQIQEKPEYKKLYNATYGTSQGLGKTISIGGQDYIEYDGVLYTADAFNKKFGNAISVSPEVMSQGLDTFKKRMQSLVATGGAIRKGWCGEPVNDYLKSIGSNVQYDNDLQTKLDSITPGAGPKVGSIAIWDGTTFNSPDAKKHGHVAIVTGVDEKNGTITVLESNGQAHKMGMGYGKYNMANVTGYYDPSAGYSSSDTTNTKSVGGLSDKQLTQLAKDYINGEKTYSDIKATFGDDVLNAVGLRAANLADEGYERSTKITDPNKQASLEEKLRKEYDKVTEDAVATINRVKKMDDAYAQVDDNLNTASQALVIAYNKILDEASVVREGEYARTAEGQSLLDQMAAKAKQIAEGGAGISKDTLKSLVDVAHTFSKNAENYQLDTAKRTKISIDKYGLTPEAILPGDVLAKLDNSQSTTTSSSNGTQEQNFYQKYANTAPGTGKKRPYGSNNQGNVQLSNGQSFNWNS